MFTESDFEYAVENTHVLLSPTRRIQTNGETVFHYTLVSELMDDVNKVRVRGGRIDAERPTIITPDACARLLLEGFGGQAAEFADWLREQPTRFSFLRYGFQVKKSNMREEIVQDSLDAVIERVTRLAQRDDSGASAVIHGVDDTWEVCLLKFTVDLIQNSVATNLSDFQRRGLL
jgi:hypothetical protein